MNSKELFSVALNMGKPWYIKEIELKKSEKGKFGELHIYLDFEVGSKFIDEKQEKCGVYDTEERQWKHLNFFEHECYLHALGPKD